MKNMRFFYLPIIIITIFCVGLILFLGGRFIINALKPDPELVAGFPETSSPARDDFLMRLTTVPQQSIISMNDDNVHLVQFKSEQSKLEYYVYPDDLLRNLLQNATEQPAGDTMFLHLADEWMEEIQEFQVSSQEIGLPSIEVHQNYLQIKTERTEEQINIDELFDVKAVNKGALQNIQVLAVDESSFALAVTLYVEDSKDVYYFLARNDLSDKVAFHEEDYAEKITTGDVSSFESLIFKEKIDDRFYVINGSQGIYDAKNNQVLFVGKQDRMSVDGKFVYIGGNDDKIKKGKQRIQRTEDYFSGSNNDYATFDLPFKEVGKEFDFTPFTFGSHANLHYFSEDYMIYSFSYDALFFGTSGSTNVIADLQEDKDNPTFYIEEFGIRSSINE